MVEILERWTVPLPWVVFLLLQTVGGAFWIASLQAKTDKALESAIQNEQTRAQVVINSNRLTRLETQFEGLQRDFEKLETVQQRLSIAVRSRLPPDLGQER